ncbi:hypothetical protein [Clostridium estertheticum]|uniref:DUF4268 domain-containing protein n=1 Tax=Clostridium estertheticum TaxID=238834 RepID=A0A7Y3SZM0_9CLOT|nr:hypothetical protein [Clostridium estertheticum]NNU78167.1 hypothetical protein [Clostridium estertheticum]WBL47720.1 hypothetical protein LOR37_03255 [Clostridium estertheticum]
MEAIQVSFDGSRKEYLYSIYLKKNWGELSKKIGADLKEDDIMLEREYRNERYKRYADISGIDEKGRRLFCEIQLSKSDEIHYNQIVQLIDLGRNEESTVIIWIATGFNSVYITKLMQLIICNSGKNIELVFLALKYDVIELLTEVNQCEQIGQIKMLNRLNDIEEHFILKNGIKNYNGIKVCSAKDIPLQEAYSYKQKILIRIVKRLRQDCGDYGNTYKYKNVAGNYFIIGAGYGGIDFKITADRKHRIGIVLAFSNVKSKKIYFELKKESKTLNDQFNFMLTWKDEFEQISTFLSFGWFSDKEKMILIFGRIVKQYLYGFDKYLKEAIDKVKDIR